MVADVSGKAAHSAAHYTKGLKACGNGYMKQGIKALCSYSKWIGFIKGALVATVPWAITWGISKTRDHSANKSLPEKNDANSNNRPVNEDNDTIADNPNPISEETAE